MGGSILAQVLSLVQLTHHIHKQKIKNKKGGKERKKEKEDSLEHILRNSSYPTHSRLARQAGGLLQAGLDGVDGGVAERAHGARHKTDERGLVARDSGAAVLRLPILQDLLEFGVCGEVDRLVGSYAGVVLA